MVTRFEVRGPGWGVLLLLCVGSVGVATAASGVPGAAVRLEGTAFSFGADPLEGGRPPLEGLAEFVSEDRVVFGERLDSGRLSVSLVKAGAAGLQVLDQEVLDLYVERYFGSWDWSDRFLTFLVPLGPERVVVVGTRQRVELLGLEGGEVKRLSRYALPPTSDSVLAGVGRGERFWTCSSYYVTAWRVGPNDALTMDTPGSFILPAPCRTLELAPDGRRLWAGTQRGVVPVDLSGPVPVVGRAIHPRTAFFQVRARDGFVVAQELIPYGELGRIRVFREADMTGAEAEPSPVRDFSPRSDAVVWERPVGFVLNARGLLVQWFRYLSPTRVYVAEAHALDAPAGTPPRGAVVVRESDETGLLLSPLSMTGAGRFGVLQPWRRVVEVDEAGTPRFVTGLGHGSLERLWVDARGGVTALGPFGAHRVRVPMGQGPVLVEGGQALPPGTQRLRLLPSPTREAAWELVTLPAAAPSVVQEEGTALVSCLRPGFTGALELAGTARLPGGPAALASARGALLQVAALPGDAWRVRAFQVPSDCPDAALVPAREWVLRGVASGEDTRSGWAIAADAERPELLLGEVFYRPSTGTARLGLTWFAGASLAEAARAELVGTTSQFTALALARERAVVIENRRQLYVLERAGEAIRTRRSVDLSTLHPPLEVSALLAFDGEVAWLAVSSQPVGVVALRVEDLALLARVDTPGTVRSLAFADGRWILGMNAALSSAAP
ncbi:hypothetical protein [Corallococcus macrosporus]|uniref:Uncharacterized protein n=1 Tax=Corallococcus macrosporus DSM 14697 TaxID=1189310 RepID=A0A250JXT3_9BACT|nr:hypothetical protein [Corallococcus macrosporus]ATB48272.1 hypothetical protein MYMAC_003898 [Corallococcus macrosporus DSM 14697]